MPRPAAPAAPTVYRAQSRPPPPIAATAAALSRLPGPRLTALGSGLLATLTMLLVGFLDALLLDGAPGVYGVFFVLTAAACALWVRPADLMIAPVGVPIAFAVGAIAISDDSGGTGGRIMSVVTALAVHAGWLYAGTVLAVLIVCVRRAALVSRQHRERRQGR
ncbi:membrane protein, partial [Streptomyces varsoviensis]